MADDTDNYKGVFQNSGKPQRQDVQDSFNNQQGAFTQLKNYFSGSTPSPTPTQDDMRKAMINRAASAGSK